MKKNSFKNICYKNNMGNIKLENDTLIFEPDKKSANNSELIIKIAFGDIDKQALKKSIDKNNSLNLIVINAKNKEYEFDFDFDDEYKDFIDIIYEKLLLNNMKQ